VSAERRGSALLPRFGRGEPSGIDRRHSLAVTDLTARSFSFAEVMTTIADQIGTSPRALFEQ
jgi:hypothetical protein